MGENINQLKFQPLPTFHRGLIFKNQTDAPNTTTKGRRTQCAPPHVWVPLDFATCSLLVALLAVWWSRECFWSYERALVTASLSHFFFFSHPTLPSLQYISTVSLIFHRREILEVVDQSRSFCPNLGSQSLGFVAVPRFSLPSLFSEIKIENHFLETFCAWSSEDYAAELVTFGDFVRFFFEAIACACAVILVALCAVLGLDLRDLCLKIWNSADLGAFSLQICWKAWGGGRWWRPSFLKSNLENLSSLVSKSF